jgi:cytochrome c-type biogenesis protein CcmE
MPSLEMNGQSVRLMTFLGLVVSLVALLLWAGTLSPNPGMNSFPGNAEAGPNPSVYLGQHVSLGGTVVSTQPVVVEIEYGVADMRQITFVNLDRSVSEGQQITGFGVLTDGSTLVIERVIVRSPWEIWYMYVISFFGGLWVLSRIVTHWEIDRDQLAFRPRCDDDG